jgi:3-oxoacyl-[acyl-carrier-protein] synthase III
MPVITSSSYVFGKKCATSSLKNIGMKRESILNLMVRGATHYYQATDPLFSVAKKAAVNTLAKSNLAKDSIDVLLIGTNSMRANDFLGDFGQKLLSELKLSNAYVQLVGFQNCGDSIPLLKTARSMLLSGEAENVLIVIADDVVASNIPRVLMDSYIHSDGAASVVLSKNGSGLKLEESEIRHLQLNNSRGFDPYDLGAQLDTLLSYAVDITNKMFVNNYFPKFIITHNMNRLYNSSIASAFNITVDAVIGNYPLGHCLASDVFINISDLFEEKKLCHGDVGLILAPNSRSVGVYKVRFVENNHSNGSAHLDNHRSKA